MILAPRPALHSLVKRYLEYTEPVPLRVAIGTYNINGGKHFRSIVFKDVSLSDWLLDAHKTQKESGKYLFLMYFMYYIFKCLLIYQCFFLCLPDSTNCLLNVSLFYLDMVEKIHD